MLPALILTALLAQTQPGPAMVEPDGSRTLGVVPPFRGQPAPPVWLRTQSHAIAALDCRHYLYEAYGDGKGRWLVRYVSFPEGEEAFRELEQVFLFRAERTVKGQVLQIGQVTYEPTSASFEGKSFVLVDRRDLMRP